MASSAWPNGHARIQAALQVMRAGVPLRIRGTQMRTMFGAPCLPNAYELRDFTGRWVIVHVARLKVRPRA